jgi:hypothetical protein
VVPHNDAEATAHAVGRILRDHRLARQMADEAARLAAPMMWSAVARRYHDMFAPLLSDYGMVGAPVLAGAGVRSQVA